MSLIGHIVSLAYKDYSHEWRMSGCFVLGLAAVLAPLMVVFGLKFGIVTGMMASLTEQPRNREIRPVGSGNHDAKWFDTLRARPDVAFVIPRTRSLAATIDLKSDTAAHILEVELTPTGPGDPVLNMVKTLPNQIDAVVLTEGAARKLNVNKAGTVIDGSVVRQYGGVTERVHIKLKVVEIARGKHFAGVDAYAHLDVLLALADFRDGRAVPALNWQGDAPVTERQHPSFRLYAKSIRDVVTLANVVSNQGHDVKTQLPEIETVLSVDRNLTIVFWIIALAGLIGFSLSLGASLWANVDRKRRELSVLRLVGFRGRGIVLFPVVQALFTAVLGWLIAVLVYLGVERAINLMLAPKLEAKQSICFLLPEHFLAALALSLLSALLAAILGGIKAAGIEPSEGLREI